MMVWFSPLVALLAQADIEQTPPASVNEPAPLAERCPSGFAEPEIYRFLSAEPEVIYPARALQQGLEGVVEMQLLVGCDGVVKQCGILTSSGHRVLDEQACQIMARKAFQPPRDESGQPREARYSTSLTFSLD